MCETSDVEKLRGDACLAHGVLHGECMTIHGKTMAEMLKDVPAEPRKDQDVIRPWSNPLYKQGHLAILKGNLAPEGCVAKITGLKKVSITGPARVFDSEEDAIDGSNGRCTHHCRLRAIATFGRGKGDRRRAEPAPLSTQPNVELTMASPLDAAVDQSATVQYSKALRAGSALAPRITSGPR